MLIWAGRVRTNQSHAECIIYIKSSSKLVFPTVGRCLNEFFLHCIPESF